MHIENLTYNQNFLKNLNLTQIIIHYTYEIVLTPFTFQKYTMQGKYCNRRKIRLWDFDVFIHFEVSGIHICYFCGGVCMYVCVYVSEHDSV